MLRQFTASHKTDREMFCNFVLFFPQPRVSFIRKIGFVFCVYCFFFLVLSIVRCGKNNVVCMEK